MGVRTVARGPWPVARPSLPHPASAPKRRRGWGWAVILVVVAAVAVGATPAQTPEERFREATRLVQSGDLQKAIAGYGELAAAGFESASLYWNWAQAASSRGALGEALWALLRAREIERTDAALGREIERLRAAANLDAAELAPSPLAAVARVSRHLHLDLVAALMLLASVAAHALARTLRSARWPVPLAWLTLVIGALAAAAVLVGSTTPPTAVVVRRGVPLADAASPTGSVLATLREGEVVPVLGASGGYLRIQDSSGARGWVTADDVWRLDRPLLLLIAGGPAAPHPDPRRLETPRAPRAPRE